MCEMMGELYPEILQKKSHIEKVLLSEEESFGHTLDRGLNHFEKIFSEIGDEKVISGSAAFKLYDTYGFPWTSLSLWQESVVYMLKRKSLIV